jgi:spermidine/putrescine-binding protein
MNRIRFIDTMARGRISRRAMIGAAGAFGVGVSVFPARGRAAQAPLVLEWAGYDIPELFPGYVAKYGAGPDFTMFGDETEALQKVRAGFNADLMHPCSDTVVDFVEAGLTRPIDTGRLSNWPDVIPALRTTPGVVVNGSVVMVPCDWGNSSLIYRTDLVDPAFQENESWSILYDERYAGRIASREGDVNVQIAGLVLGFGKLEVFHMTDEQIAQTRPLLEKQMQVTRLFWDDPAEFEQAMASGEIVVAYAWNEAVKNLREQGVPVKYSNPKEGILTWLCGLTLLDVGEGDLDMAYDFMDAWLSPEAGKYLIEEYGYGHGNAKAFAAASPDALADLGFSTDPTVMLAEGVLFQPVPGDIRTKYINLFEEVRASAGF